MSLPQPDEDWYDPAIGTAGLGGRSPARATPDQRRSLLRYVLSGNGGEQCSYIRHFATWEPAALLPWAPHLADLDDAGIATLVDVDWTGYWTAFRGAGDAAAERMAARIAAAPPGPWRPSNSPDPAQARVSLLIGADSDRALHLLGELGRAFEPVRAICADRGVHVPDAGPARRRYTWPPRRIVLGDAPAGAPRTGRPADTSPTGLRTDVPARGLLADERGLMCALPLRVLLEIGEPLLAWPHHFIGSLCEDCDEGTLSYRGWPRPDPLIAFDEERDEYCEGSPRDDSALPTALRLCDADPWAGRATDAGQLGGWPDWLQYPSWNECCGRPLLFVASLDLDEFAGVGRLFGFRCDVCEGTVQLHQMT